jgi:hypothetical protein
LFNHYFYKILVIDYMLTHRKNKVVSNVDTNLASPLKGEVSGEEVSFRGILLEMGRTKSGGYKGVG